MDPIELAQRVARDFFRARQFLAAAIVYGECVKRSPRDAALLLGFGLSVGNEAGLVGKPFIEWSARILDTCLFLDPSGPHGEVARQGLAALANKAGYVKKRSLRPADVEPLLDFLDIAPATVIPDAVEKLPVEALPADNRMFAIMGLGGLGSPRFASSIARAVSGAWGERAGCAALKRIRPYASHRIVRDALVVARARPTAEEEFGPYLRSAEAMVASIPITIETPTGYRKVRPPGAAADDEATEPPSTRPWWKLWSAR